MQSELDIKENFGIVRHEKIWVKYTLMINTKKLVK